MPTFKKYYKKITSSLVPSRFSKSSNKRHEEPNKKSNRGKKPRLPDIVQLPSTPKIKESTSQQFKESHQVKESQLLVAEVQLKAQLDKASRLEKTKLDAQKQIQLSPESATASITLIKVLKQQSDLLTALKICIQGLSSVSADKSVQRFELQKEMRIISATLLRLNMQLSLIPYEIWQLIFQLLDAKDLRQCAAASSLWSNMLLELPWDTFFLSRVRTDKANEPLVLTIHSGSGSSREISLKDIFMILSYWKSNTFQSIKFAGYRLEYGHDTIEEQLNMFATIDTPFKHVIFQHTSFYTEEFIPTLESCSKVEWASFVDIKLDYSDQFFARRNIELPCLKLLDLSFSASQLQFWENQADALIDSVAPMLRQCPNLTRLTLDNATAPLQKYFAAQALEHCPRLEILAITIRSVKNVEDIVDSFEAAHLNTSTALSSTSPSTNGIRLFVHRPAIDKSGYEFVNTIFDKSFESLERTELIYEGCYINTTVLSTLASHGAPCLREIQFSVFDHDMAKQTGLPIDQVLIELFSKCPSIEVARIRLFGKYFITEHNRNAELLMTIAKNCSLLRQLLFRVHTYRFDTETMYQFATTAGPHLQYLFINMDTSVALEVIQKIATLVYFSGTSYVGEIFEISAQRENPEMVQEIERILRSRCGSSQMIDDRIFSRYY